MDNLTPSQQAAAFHGLATNGALPPHERLALALQALALYEAEVERLTEQTTTHTDDDTPGPLTTAQALSRFHDELVVEGFQSRDVTTVLLTAVLSALVARDGLIVKTDPPAEEERGAAF